MASKQSLRWLLGWVLICATTVSACSKQSPPETRPQSSNSSASTSSTNDPLLDELEDPQELQQVGIRYIEDNQPQNAILALRKSLRAYSRNAETHMWMGAALTMTRQFDEALASFDRALELNSQLTETHNWLGIYWYQRNEPQRAVSEFQIALADPTYPAISRLRVLMNLGRILLELNQLDSAINTLAQAAEMRVSSGDPVHSLIRVLLAQALLKQGRPLEAIRALEPIKNERGSSAETNLITGLAYRDLGEHTSARRHLEAVLRLAPGSDLSEQAIEALQELPPGRTSGS